jgi:hypothetical protein
MGLDDGNMSDEAGANDGWIRLLEEMEAMEDQLRQEGWETLTIAAGDAAPVVPEKSRLDRHGFAYVIPGDDAERFAELFVPEGFPRTEVYRAVEGSNLFVLTVFRDPPTEAAILLAGVLDLANLDECREISERTGTMNTHVLKIDGTHVGSFEHDDPKPFFPDNSGKSSKDSK